MSYVHMITRGKTCGWMITLKKRLKCRSNAYVTRVHELDAVHDTAKVRDHRFAHESLDTNYRWLC